MGACDSTPRLSTPQGDKLCSARLLRTRPGLPYYLHLPLTEASGSAAYGNAPVHGTLHYRPSIDKEPLMMHSPDNAGFLAQLLADYPGQAETIQQFASLHGLPITPEGPPTSRPGPGITPPSSRPADPPSPHSPPNQCPARSTSSVTPPTSRPCQAWSQAALPTLQGESVEHRIQGSPRVTTPGSAPTHTTPPSEALSGAALVAKVVSLRHQRGLTQAALAARLGISLRTWQEWEQGRRCPSGPAEAALRGWLLGIYHLPPAY
ncbi:helix-turn-helix domain-containing protein [Halomonas tibetensis]